MNQEQAELQIESLVELIDGKIEYITSYHSSGTSAKKIIITYSSSPITNTGSIFKKLFNNFMSFKSL